MRRARVYVDRRESALVESGDILVPMREGLIDIAQLEPFAPLHVRLAAENRMLRLVANNERPDEVAAAVASGEDVFEPEPEAGTSDPSKDPATNE